MTRDEALKIARRIMDRIEQDRAIHLDAMADEIVAGMAIAEREPQKPDWVSVREKRAQAEEIQKLIGLLETSKEAKAAIAKAVSDACFGGIGVWLQQVEVAKLTTAIKGHKADMLIVDDVMMGRLEPPVDEVRTEAISDAEHASLHARLWSKHIEKRFGIK